MQFFKKINQIKKYIYFILILIFSLIFRNLNNKNYVFDGTDITSHILASLRLSSTYYLKFEFLAENFFAQIAQFSHGYTGIFINWVIFEFIFDFLNIPIKEENFIVISTLISVIGVTSIYLLFKSYIKKINFKYFIYFLMICNIPLFVAHSRVFAGYIILSLTLFTLSIYFLNEFLNHNKVSNKNFYFITTFFYIGSNNAFILGIFFHFFYIFAYENNFIYKMDFKEKILLFFKNTKKIYFNFNSIIFILLPIIGYLIITYLLIKNNIISGYLLRLLSKSNELNFNFYDNTIYLLNHFGPVLLIIIIFFIKNIIFKKIYFRNISFLDIFFILYFICYFLLINISNSSDHYLLFLILPIGYFLLKTIKKTNLYLVSIIFLINICFSYALVYKNISFDNNFLITQNDERYTPGVNHNVDYDKGFKTLGYFLRNNMIRVSKINTPKKGFSNNVFKLGVVTRLGGAEYYFNEKYEIQDSDNFEMLDKYENYLMIIVPSSTLTPNYVEQPENPENFNDIIMREVNKRNLNQLLFICKNNEVIMRVFGNQDMYDFSNKCIDANEYNLKFNNEFKNINNFSKNYLGQF